MDHPLPRRRLAAALLLALALLAPAAAQPPPPLPPADEPFDIIVAFRAEAAAASLRALKAMCTRSDRLFALLARRLRLAPECHIGPALCRRMYSNTVFGFAGRVTAAQLDRVQACLPGGAVWYRELDGRVEKAEDARAARPAPPLRPAAAPAAGRRLRQAPPGPRVSAAEAGAGGAAGAAAEARGVDWAAVSGGAPLSAPGRKAQALPAAPPGVLWNLDRLDQRELPLDGRFSYGGPDAIGTGAGVTVYVVDSGILAGHQEFLAADGSGASRAAAGYDFVDADGEGADCDGHGTHVAATAVGLQVGVAKAARVVGVRILDCQGSGTVSDTVAGLDWVGLNAQGPSVVTLSLGIAVGSWSRVLEDAVRALTARGIPVVVAAGNAAVDACGVAPANVPDVLTVAATDLRTKRAAANGTAAAGGPEEEMYRWSNTGPCVDLFAPGVDVYSACGGRARCADPASGRQYAYASGTSMAVPLAAGVVAALLGDAPGATPAQAARALAGAATPGRVAGALRAGTPNRLLYSRLGDRAVTASAGP